MNIPEIVQKTITEYNLISRGDRVLIAFSGGSDSTALLHILYELSKKTDFSIAAAHVNHCLRDTAERDMIFAEKLCKKLDIPFYSKTCDVKKEAAKQKMSEELYARKIRYDFFSSLGFDKIATAHNKNDSAETILFHFLRGSSINGLSGIPYRRGNIIRPLLDVKKEDIETFCYDNNFEFVTDETNLKPIYTRNILRLEIIPEIEKKINSGFCDIITNNAVYYREDAEFLNELAEKEYTVPLDIDKLNTLPDPLKRRVIQLHFKNSTGETENLSSVYIKSIASLCKKNKTGSRISLPHGYEAVSEYGTLVIKKAEQDICFEYNIFPNRLLKIDEIGKTVLIYPDKNGSIHLDSEDGLVIRSRKKGDVFYPEKMNGKKKLSDYFTDKKIPRSKRAAIPVLTYKGDIVSVIGMRNDRRFTDPEKPAYKIEIKEAENADKTF